VVQNGYDQQLAIDAAQTLTAVGGFRQVLLNDDSVDVLDWPQRIALLAHELTHTLQYEVLIALRFTIRQQARRLAVQRVRDARMLPTLLELVTFPDWVRVAQRTGTDALYAQAMLAATLLIERQGPPALVAYFQQFGRSNDRLGNFRIAFGEDLEAFDRKFRTHLDTQLR
jgi:hypothetical protein